MKKLIFLLIAFAFVGSLFAADTDRYYFGTLTKKETATEVIYTWVAVIPAVGAASGYSYTDQLHSPPMLIADCNATKMFARAVIDASSDVNVFYHFGTGRQWFSTVTPSALDAVAATALYDTVNTVNSRIAKYFVCEIDSGGSTGTMAGRTATLIFTFTKDYWFNEGGQSADVGYIVRKNDTGWTNP